MLVAWLLGGPVNGTARHRLITRNAGGELYVGRFKLSDVIGVVGGTIGAIGGLVGLITSIVLWVQSLAPYDLQIDAPEQAEIRCYPEPEQGGCADDSFLTFTAMTLGYENVGNLAKTPRIVREELLASRAEIDTNHPQKSITLHWQWFSNIGVETRGQTAAVPFVVGLEGAAHETQFLPWIVEGADEKTQHKDFYYWKDFIADIRAAQQANKPVELTLVFNAYQHGNETPAVSATCRFRIDEQTVTYWTTPGDDTFQRRFACLKP